MTNPKETIEKLVKEKNAKKNNYIDERHEMHACEEALKRRTDIKI